jgi:hypothetical protein
MLLITQLAGESILCSDCVNVVLQLGSNPGVELVGGGHTLVGMSAGPPEKKK